MVYELWLLSFKYTINFCHRGVDPQFLFVIAVEPSEQLLEKYEKEIKKWQDFHAENREIFDALDKLLATFRSMRELEEKAKDPNRLKNNRGGALLKEEKERKRIKTVSLWIKQLGAGVRL